MKTKFLFVTILTLLSITNYAQQFLIEVVATDTIILNPTSFTYEITMGNQVEFMGMTFPGEEDENEESTEEVSVEDITSRLKSNRFDYEISTANDFSIGKDEKAEKILVFLKNKSDLERLYNTFKDQEGITGKVKDIAFESPNKHYDKLYQRLYDDALAQATSLANTLEAKILGLKDVIEITEQMDGFMGMYKEMMKEMPLKLFGDFNLMQKKVERKFRFQFYRSRPIH